MEVEPYTTLEGAIAHYQGRGDCPVLLSLLKELYCKRYPLHDEPYDYSLLLKKYNGYLNSYQKLIERSE